MYTDRKEDELFIKSSYRPEIDGLRAFAVVAVIINHFNKEILPRPYAPKALNSNCATLVF